MAQPPPAPWAGWQRQPWQQKVAQAGCQAPATRAKPAVTGRAGTCLHPLWLAVCGEGLWMNPPPPNRGIPEVWLSRATPQGQL